MVAVIMRAVRAASSVTPCVLCRSAVGAEEKGMGLVAAPGVALLPPVVAKFRKGGLLAGRLRTATLVSILVPPAPRPMPMRSKRLPSLTRVNSPLINQPPDFGAAPGLTADAGPRFFDNSLTRYFDK